MLLKVLGTSLFASLLLAAPALADGNVKTGKKIFKKCKACHTLKEGKNRVGPSLYGIVDKPSGTVEGFKYSDAMATANLIWDADTLTAFLTNPSDVVPKTNMVFPGLKKPQQITDLIAYLREAGQS